MTIKVNNKDIEWKENETIKDLLKRVKYTFPLLIVKINNKYIPREDFSKKTIPNNSTIDVIHMISGG